MSLRDTATDAPVGIVGLGAIGGGVAKALGRSGRGAIGFDVRSEASAALGAAVTGAPTPQAVAAAADLVLIAVMDDAQVREVLAGRDGLLAASEPPAVVVILSTVTLDTIRWAHARCAERGVTLIDCGVSGGLQALEDGSITAMVGGPLATVESIRPVLSAFADPVVHVGEVGNGMRAKLARNLVIYVDWMVAWEGARLAAAAGIGLDEFVQIVKASERHTRSHLHLLERGVGFGSAPAADAYGERIARYADKDLRAALALGEELGLELPAAEAAVQWFPAAAGVSQTPPR